MRLQSFLRQLLQSVAALAPILILFVIVFVWAELHILRAPAISSTLMFFLVPVAIITISIVSCGVLTCIWMRRRGCTSFKPTDGIRLFIQIGFDLPSHDFLNKLSYCSKIPIDEIRERHITAFREWLSSIPVGPFEEEGGFQKGELEPKRMDFPKEPTYPGKRILIIGVIVGLPLWIGLTSLLWGVPIGLGVGIMPDIGNMAAFIYCSGFIAICFLFGLGPSLYVKKQLIERGYHWVGMKQARYIWFRIGPRYFKLLVPNREELLVIENYQDGNVESLVHYLTCRDND